MMSMPTRLQERGHFVSIFSKYEMRSITSRHRLLWATSLSCINLRAAKYVCIQRAYFLDCHLPKNPYRLLGAAIAHNRLVGLATATTAADTSAAVAPVTVSACCLPVISSLHSKCERGLKADNMRAQVFRNCRASTAALAPLSRGVSLPWRKRRPCLLFLSNFDRYIRLSLVFRL